MNASDQSIVLGTAQWGLDYGRTNHQGRIPDDELMALAAAARVAGIHLLDTAAGYGDSEARISEVGLGFSVQTKIAISGLDASAMQFSLQDSCLRLSRDSIDGVLVHDWDVADSKSRFEAADFLRSARETGLVRRIGVSVYSDAELESAIETVPDLDLVQVPVSVLDQRLDGKIVIRRLRDLGVTIQARSILLQGILASPESAGELGNHPDVDNLQQKLPSSTAERIRFALGYVGSRDWIDEIVFAASSTSELDELWNAWMQREENADWSVYASEDVSLLDPRRWPPRDELNS